MGTVTESIDVDVDAHTAYNQWTQFESFPEFMSDVEEVRQIDETRLHWITKVGPSTREFDATVTEQRPDERVAWSSTEGPEHAGVVTFEALDVGRTRVTAEMTIDPDGFVENVADKTGVLDRRVKSNMKSFKNFIEQRGNETGGWRGEVPPTTP